MASEQLNPSGSTGREKVRPYLVLAALFLFAFSIRLVYLFDLSQSPLFDTVLKTMDHFNFDQGAINFSEGDWLARGPNNSYSPLYKYFLGVIYYLFGRNFYAVYSIQFAMGALASVLVYLIARDAFGRRAGIFAFLGFALYGTEIIYEGTILRAAFITFFGLCSFYLLSRLKDAPFSAGRLVFASVVLSLFFQSRPNIFLCLPLICVFLHKYVFHSLTVDGKRRAWAVFVGTLLLSFVPLLVQCYLVHGRFVFFDTGGPVAFIAGNLISYSGAGYEPEVVKQFDSENQRGYGAVIGYLFNHILENPLAFLGLYLRKIYFFLNDFEAPSNISVYLYRESSNVLSWFLNHFGWYSSLGLVGIVLAARNKKETFLLHAYLSGLFLSVVLFHVVARFRLPLVPFLIIFAAYALSEIVGWIRSKRAGPALATVVAVSLLFFAFRMPGKALPVRQVDYGNFSIAYFNDELRFDLVKAEAYALQCWNLETRNDSEHHYGRQLLSTIYNLYGFFLWEKGRVDGAKKALERSLMVNPFDSNPYRLISGMELDRKDESKALRMLNIGIAADPLNRNLTENLVKLHFKRQAESGVILAGLNRWLALESDVSTIDFLKEEIKKLNVESEQAGQGLVSSMGQAREYFLEGKWETALEKYEAANRINDFDAGMYLEHGITLENLKRQEEAVRVFYEGLLVDPNNGEIHKHLADHFLASNQSEFAIVHLTRTLDGREDDPAGRNILEALRLKLDLRNLDPLVSSLTEEDNRRIFELFQGAVRFLT